MTTNTKNNFEKIASSLKRVRDATNLPYNTVFRRFFLDELAILISSSPYGQEFVFKGGLVLSNMLGIATRQTRDVDATYLKDINEIEDKLQKIFKDDSRNGINFKTIKTEAIMHGIGIRAKIVGTINNIKETIELDVSPYKPSPSSPIEYSYVNLYANDTQNIMVDAIEKILAEKLHAIIHHGIKGSRYKDYLDIYLIFENKELFHFDVDLMFDTFASVFKNNNETLDKDSFLKTVTIIKENPTIHHNVDNYIKTKTKLTIDASKVINTVIDALYLTERIWHDRQKELHLE